MILELSAASQLIRVTAEYSNAVLVAVLPCVSNYVEKLQLPLEYPVTAAHVVKCGVSPVLEPHGRCPAASVRMEGDWEFWLIGGHLTGFRGPHSFLLTQDPDLLFKFPGTLRMSQAEAVQLARTMITRSGMSLESVFAEQEPRLTGPFSVGGKTVPHYQIEWLDPRVSFDPRAGKFPAPGQGTAPAVRFEIDGETKRVEWFWLALGLLRDPPVCVEMAPPAAPGSPNWPTVNSEYAWHLLPIVLRAVTDYASTLNLPLVGTLTTNNVARFVLADNGGWPHSEVELTNGWRFIYRNSMVNGFYAPDNLFNSDNRAIRIADFTGKWKVSEPEAVELVLRALRKFNYPSNLVHVDFQPEVRRSVIASIPRLFVSWSYVQHDELVSKVEAEVDADKGELKSLYYDNTAYWNHPPPIDVPISLRTPSSKSDTPIPSASRRFGNGPPLKPPLRFHTPTPK